MAPTRKAKGKKRSRDPRKTLVIIVNHVDNHKKEWSTVPSQEAALGELAKEKNLKKSDGQVHTGHSLRQFLLKYIGQYIKASHKPNRNVSSALFQHGWAAISGLKRTRSQLTDSSDDDDDLDQSTDGSNSDDDKQKAPRVPETLVANAGRQDHDDGMGHRRAVEAPTTLPAPTQWIKLGKRKTDEEQSNEQDGAPAKRLKANNAEQLVVARENENASSHEIQDSTSQQKGSSSDSLRGVSSIPLATLGTSSSTSSRKRPRSEDDDDSNEHHEHKRAKDNSKYPTFNRPRPPLSGIKGPDGALPTFVRMEEGYIPDDEHLPINHGVPPVLVPFTYYNEKAEVYGVETTRFREAITVIEAERELTHIHRHMTGVVNNFFEDLGADRDQPTRPCFENVDSELEELYQKAYGGPGSDWRDTMSTFGLFQHQHLRADVAVRSMIGAFIFNEVFQKGSPLITLDKMKEYWGPAMMYHMERTMRLSGSRAILDQLLQHSFGKAVRQKEGSHCAEELKVHAMKLASRLSFILRPHFERIRHKLDTKKNAQDYFKWRSALTRFYNGLKVVFEETLTVQLHLEAAPESLHFFWPQRSTPFLPTRMGDAFRQLVERPLEQIVEATVFPGIWQSTEEKTTIFFRALTYVGPRDSVHEVEASTE